MRGVHAHTAHTLIIPFNQPGHGIMTKGTTAEVPTADFEVRCEYSDNQGASFTREIGFVARDGLKKSILIPLSDLNSSRLSRAVAALDDAGAKTPFDTAVQRALVANLRSAEPSTRGKLVGRNGAFGLGTSFLFSGHQYGNGERVRLRPKLERHPLNESASLSQGKQELLNWKRAIPEAVRGTPVLVVTLCLPFVGLIAGPLDLAEGFGLMLVGETSMGKSLATVLAASVWGDPDQFVRKWNTTENSLEVLAALNSHTLLALDETAALGGGTDVLLRGVMRLVAGKEKHRLSGGLELDKWYTVLLTSSEKGLAELAAHDGADLRPGHGVRLVDVPAEGDRPGTIFDVLPKGLKDVRFYEQLDGAARRHFGVAGDKCATYLTDDLAKNGRKDVVAWLDARRRSFLDNLRPQPVSGAEHRVASHFALIYAAGRLASDYGILPYTRDEVFSACETVLNRSLRYGRSVTAKSERATIETVLKFLRMSSGGRMDAFRNTHESSGQQIFQTGKTGREELWIQPSALQGLFEKTRSLESILQMLSLGAKPVLHNTPVRKATVARKGADGRKRFVVLSGTLHGVIEQIEKRLKTLDTGEEV